MIVIPFHSYLLKMSAIGHSLPQIWAIVITSKTETKVEKKRKKKGIFIRPIRLSFTSLAWNTTTHKIFKKGKITNCFLVLVILLKPPTPFIWGRFHWINRRPHIIYICAFDESITIKTTTEYMDEVVSILTFAKSSFSQKSIRHSFYIQMANNSISTHNIKISKYL